MDRRTADFDGQDDDDNFFEALSSDDDGDDEFFEASRMSLVSASIKRMYSIGTSSMSNPSSSIATSTSVLLPAGNYDMWISEPGDLKERRKRLLQGMGVASNKVDFLRLSTSKRIHAISIKLEPDTARVPISTPIPTPTPEPKNSGSSGIGVGVDSSVEEKNSSTEESKKDGGGSCGSGSTAAPLQPPPPSYRAIVLVRSRSDGDIELFSSKIKQRKEELIGPISKNKLTRTLSGQLAPSTGVSHYALFPKIEKARKSNRNDGVSQCVITDDGFGSFFLIKNLDTGKDFIVKDINEQGMWNSLNDVQTGKQLTMEEFEKSVGYSPVVKELMRRASRNINGGRKVKKGFRNMSTRKGASLLKSIKGAAAHSVKGLKVEKEDQKEEKEEENWTSNSNSKSNSTSPKMSLWVDAHQHGKTYKEFTALHLCREIRAHEGSIWAMSFSPDCRFLASGGEDSVVHVWEVQECEVVLPGEGGGAAVEETGEGGGAAEGGGANRVEISSMPSEMWRKGRKSGKGNPVPDYVKFPEKVVALSETPMCSFQGHTDQVLDLCWSKTQVLLSSSMDKTVKMWDLETKSCLKTFPHKDYVTCIQFNPVDENLFISGSLDGKVRIWSINDNRVADWTDVHEMVTAVSYTPDGQGAIIGTQEGSCGMYSTQNSILEHQMDIQKKKKPPAKKFPPAKKLPGFQSPAPLGKITGFQFSPWNQSEVLITSADSRIGIYNSADIVQKFKGFRNTSSQISASFTPNGKHILSASEDSQVYIWKVEESKNPTSGKKKTALIIQAHEHFQCKDVSVAITWPGSTKIEPPVVDLNPKKKPSRRPSTAPPLPPNPTATEPPPPAEEGDNPNMNGGGGTSLPPLPKKRTPSTEEIAGFGDEHETTLSGTESASDGESSSQTTLCDNGSGNSNTSGGTTIQATAWGVVIATASSEGDIRLYQNFGLPLKLARPLF